MPTEQQLARTFDVSRITAKRAMDELASESLIARYRGKGSHVTYQYKPKPVQAPLVGMLENLIEMGKHSIVRVISIDKVVPPADIRETLGLDDENRCTRLCVCAATKKASPTRITSVTRLASVVGSRSVSSKKRRDSTC